MKDCKFFCKSMPVWSRSLPPSPSVLASLPLPPSPNLPPSFPPFFFSLPSPLPYPHPTLLSLIFPLSFSPIPTSTFVSPSPSPSPSLSFPGSFSPSPPPPPYPLCRSFFKWEKLRPGHSKNSSDNAVQLLGMPWIAVIWGLFVFFNLLILFSGPRRPLPSVSGNA